MVVGILGVLAGRMKKVYFTCTFCTLATIIGIFFLLMGFMLTAVVAILRLIGEPDIICGADLATALASGSTSSVLGGLSSFSSGGPAGGMKRLDAEFDKEVSSKMCSAECPCWSGEGDEYETMWKEKFPKGLYQWTKS